ncbi:Uncharacterized conserved protein [Phaffia rhodozyma]|uniref:Uncharacterized conserved protein n=1 Tax=Phaffia rhodozyma TaxID=264483 RepID=A0A0F7SQT2_PHARH|nr:Uncharacterized conserved protein [Phaffia rhodozyma]
MAPSKRSNASLLSEGAAYIKKKRRNAGKEAEVEKVVFDDEARAEFLTGFSKRKQAKIAAKREKAIEREKNERREEKRELRQERKKRAQENLEIVERAYGLEPSSNAEAGPSTFPSEPLEEEFSDGEEQHAVVTVIEDDFALETPQATNELSLFPSDTPFIAPTNGPASTASEKPKGPPAPQRPKNKSGKKTLLKGTKKLLRQREMNKKRFGADSLRSASSSKDKKRK